MQNGFKYNLDYPAEHWTHASQLRNIDYIATW